jgi:hypothetical protein
MDGHHHLVWEAAFFNRPDDVGGGVVAAAQEVGRFFDKRTGL